MMNRIGTCSICGGDVVGVIGIWMSVTPPPPATCSRCGAVERRDIIEMHTSPNKSVNTYEDFNKKNGGAK